MDRTCDASKAIDGNRCAPQSRRTMSTTTHAPLNPDLIDTGTPPIPEAQGWARAYGGITGDASLREAYAAEISRIYGASFTPGEVSITSGCNQAYVVTMMALARA